MSGGLVLTLGQRLTELHQNSDFMAYLCHFLLYSTGEATGTRAVAGLLLKNSLSGREGPAPATDAGLVYVKTNILNGLADPDQLLRGTASTAVTMLVQCEEAGGWPEALDFLTKGMASSDDNLAEVRSSERV